MINEFLIANSSVMTLIGIKGPHIMPGLFDTFANIVDNFFNPFFEWICNKILEGVFEIYESAYDLDFGQFYNTNTIIPGLNSIVTFAKAIAWGLIFVILVTTTLRSIAGPITGSQQSNPINIFGRIIIVSAFLVIYGNLIHRMVLIGDDLLAYIRDDFAATIGLSGKISDISIDWSGSTSGFWSNNLVGLIFCCVLAYNIIMAAINQVERFVMFGLYTTICPIPIAFIADDSNSDIPKNYFMTLFSQMLAIMFNMIVFTLLSVKLNNLTSSNGNLVDWIVCIGLASVASHSENLVNAIGLKTMPTPQAAGDFMSGFKATAAAGAAAVTAARIGAGGIRKHVFGADEPMSGNKYDPAQGTSGVSSPLGASASDGKLLTKKEAEIKDGRQLGKTGYDKNKGLTAPSRPTVEDAKQSAHKHGETNARQTIAGNTADVAHVKHRMDKGYKEREAAIENINDVMKGNNARIDPSKTSKEAPARYKNKLATATGSDLSTALNLQKTMPAVDFDNNKLIRRNEDGTITATGYITKTDSNGNVYREAKNFTFGDRETISKAGLGAEFRPVTEEGNFGMVTDYAHTSDLDKMSMVDNNYLNTTKPKPGQDIERHSSGEWMDDTFKLSDRLGGNVSIDHAARINDDYASIGTVTNKDGSQTQKLYYTTTDTNLIQNGGYANGLMLDNSKIVNNGNGYYTMEATWATQKQIENKGDNAVDNLSQKETRYMIENEDVPDMAVSNSNNSHNSNNQSANNTSSDTDDTEMVAGTNPTIDDKRGIEKQMKQVQIEMDEKDRSTNKKGAKNNQE